MSSCSAHRVPTDTAVAAVVAQLASAALVQAAPSFSVPVDCAIGEACILQNYVDHGPGRRDYRCGPLTYDGHKGTDIRVTDRAAFKRGVPVLAAAPGRVRAIRDGMPDVSIRTIGKGVVAGREAGNSIVVEHGEGWETQYAHLRNGSVAVRAGDTVVRGQRLGVVGLSGNTEFHHLHFEVRYRGKTVDPFVGVAANDACDASNQPLWDDEASGVLAYVPTGMLGAGFAGAPPSLGDEGSVDPDRVDRFTPTSTAAIFWVQVYGAQADDLEELHLVAPDGRVLATRRARIARNAAQWLAYVGKRSTTPWPTGTYRGEYALYRGPQAEKVVSFTREVTLLP